MDNSSYKIFSLFKRIPDIFADMNFDLYPLLENPVPKRMFDNTKPFIKNQCYRIFNEIENSYYSFDDVVNFLIYRSLWDKSVDLPNVNDKNIEEFKLKFSIKQLTEDRRIINELNKKAGFKHISEYFVIRENGESLVYRLCMGDVVSIYFFAFFSNNDLTGVLKRGIIKECTVRYAKFLQTVQILIDRMNVQTYNSTFNERQ